MAVSRRTRIVRRRRHPAGPRGPARRRRRDRAPGDAARGSASSSRSPAARCRTRCARCARRAVRLPAAYVQPGTGARCRPRPPAAGPSRRTSSRWLLIDPKMGACQMTSRIVQATIAIQTFVDRCFLGFEPEVSPTMATDGRWDQWKWMKAYRLWEANRKVFLFPENWVEPELRRDKSFAFKELEDELLQTELTEDSARDAFLNYIDKLDQVANLDITGVHWQDGGGTGRGAVPRRWAHRRPGAACLFLPSLRPPRRALDSMVQGRARSQERASGAVHVRPPHLPRLARVPRAEARRRDIDRDPFPWRGRHRRRLSAHASPPAWRFRNCATANGRPRRSRPSSWMRSTRPISRRGSHGHRSTCAGSRPTSTCISRTSMPATIRGIRRRLRIPRMPRLSRACVGRRPTADRRRSTAWRFVPHATSRSTASMR